MTLPGLGRRCATLVAIVIGLEAALFVVTVGWSPPSDSNAFMAATLDKVALQRRATRGTVKVVGGSAAAFGVDCDALSKALGRPSVNLGLHAGIGFQLLMVDARRRSMAGDVVVLMPEYENFFGTFAYGETPLLEYLRHNRDAVGSLSSWGQVLSIQRNLLVGLKNALSGAGTESIAGLGAAAVYRRDQFDASGSMVGHLKREGSPIRHLGPYRGKLNMAFVEDLRRVVDAMQQGGVTVMLAYPPIGQTSFFRVRKSIEAVDDALRKAGLQGRLLGRPEESIVEDGELFDTPYHPGAKGRTKFTGLLAERMAKLLGQQR